MSTSWPEYSEHAHEGTHIGEHAFKPLVRRTKEVYCRPLLDDSQFEKAPPARSMLKTSHAHLPCILSSSFQLNVIQLMSERLKSTIIT